MNNKLNEIAWRHSPDDLHNILTKRPVTLRYLYCDTDYWGEDALQWESVRTRRKKLRRELERGDIMMPKRTESYPGDEPERENIRARRRRIAPKTGETALAELISLENRKRLHDQLDELIDAGNLPAEHVEQLRVKKISAWEMGYKDADGEAQSHPLVGLQLEADPRKFEPEWPVVTRVESIRLKRQEVARSKDVQTCMVFPDVQIPFESPEALDIALTVMQEIKPDKVVFLGDLLDLSAWSKYIQHKEFAFATQDAVIKAHQLLASIRKSLPNAQIQVLSGNHESRLETNLLQNAREAYGLKRADALDSWPVMSVPYLCAFDTLDVEYVPGYPANRIWLNKNLQIRHGTKTGKKGAGVRQNTAAEKVSTIQGHDHRLSMHSSTINTYEGGQQLFSYGSGCLCRLDGTVPSVWQGRDLEGVPVKQLEDWQNGFLIAHYDDDNFFVEQVPIGLDYQTMYRGKIYRPKPQPDEISFR